MKKYIIVPFLLSGCFSEKRNEPVTFDASRDTSFVVESNGSDYINLRYNIEGQLEDSTHIVVTYYITDYRTKDIENAKLNIPLQAGKVEIKNGIWDFYGPKAFFNFKHLNNKKGKLTIKAEI
jgi:hypothetical protein